jgi:hypothetical protein
MAARAGGAGVRPCSKCGWTEYKQAYSASVDRYTPENNEVSHFEWIAGYREWAAKTSATERAKLQAEALAKL